MNKSRTIQIDEKCNEDNPNISDTYIPIFREAFSVQHPYLLNIYWYVLQVILLYK